MRLVLRSPIPSPCRNRWSYRTACSPGQSPKGSCHRAIHGWLWPILVPGWHGQFLTLADMANSCPWLTWPILVPAWRGQFFTLADVADPWPWLTWQILVPGWPGWFLTLADFGQFLSLANVANPCPCMTWPILYPGRCGRSLTLADVTDPCHWLTWLILDPGWLWPILDPGWRGQSLSLAGLQCWLYQRHSLSGFNCIFEGLYPFRGKTAIVSLSSKFRRLTRFPALFGILFKTCFPGQSHKWSCPKSVYGWFYQSCSSVADRKCSLDLNP